jgi:hypothetical protein
MQPQAEDRDRTAVAVDRPPWKREQEFQATIFGSDPLDQLTAENSPDHLVHHVPPSVGSFQSLSRSVIWKWMKLDSISL